MWNVGQLEAFLLWFIWNVHSKVWTCYITIFLVCIHFKAHFIHAYNYIRCDEQSTSVQPRQGKIVTGQTKSVQFPDLNNVELSNKSVEPVTVSSKSVYTQQTNDTNVSHLATGMYVCMYVVCTCVCINVHA